MLSVKESIEITIFHLCTGNYESLTEVYTQDSPYYIKARKTFGDVAIVADKTSTDLTSMKFHLIWHFKI